MCVGNNMRVARFDISVDIKVHLSLLILRPVFAESSCPWRKRLVPGYSEPRALEYCVFNLVSPFFSQFLSQMLTPETVRKYQPDRARALKIVAVVTFARAGIKLEMSRLML